MEVPKRRRYRVVLSYLARGLYTVILVIINFLIFFIAPTLTLGFAGLLTPELKAVIAGFLGTIEVLTVMRIVLKEHVLGAVSAAALGIVEAFYGYTITRGGSIVVSFNGFSIILEFKLLVYLMMIGPILGTVEQVYEMVSRSSAKQITMIEVTGE